MYERYGFKNIINSSYVVISNRIQKEHNSNPNNVTYTCSGDGYLFAVSTIFDGGNGGNASINITKATTISALNTPWDFFSNYSSGVRAVYKITKGSVVTITSNTNSFDGTRGYETFAVVIYT